MRIVVLIGSEELQHRFVARSLAELDNVSIVIARHPRLPLLKRINGARKRFGLTVAVLRVLLNWHSEERRIIAAPNRLRHECLAIQYFRRNPSLRTEGVNSAETLSLLRKISPDILCVYGTYVVSDATLAIAPVVLNLHTGMSPRYRGADCDFWPLYERTQLDRSNCAYVHIRHRWGFNFIRSNRRHSSRKMGSERSSEDALLLVAHHIQSGSARSDFFARSQVPPRKTCPLARNTRLRCAAGWPRCVLCVQ